MEMMHVDELNYAPLFLGRKKISRNVSNHRNQNQ